MKKESTIEKRLLKYSAVAGAVVAVTGSADAQVVYHDENPDAVVTGHQMGFAIDMNNDGTDDFFAVTLDTTSNYTTYYPPYGNLSIQATYKGALLSAATGNAWMGSTGGEVEMLNTGSTIGSAGSFQTNSSMGGGTLALEGLVDISSTGGTPLVTDAPISQGVWAGAVDKYAGVNFNVGANSYYGWIRMDVSADGGTVTVKDWAYNSTSDGPIAAGSTTVGVDDMDIANLVTIRNTNNQLLVNINGELSEGAVSVTNMSGQKVSNFNAQNKFNTFSLEGLAAGIYVVTVQFEQGVVTQKIFVR